MSKTSKTSKTKLEELSEMADLIEAARLAGPMTDEQRREQAASFAFGQIALTREWQDKTGPELATLRETCRRMAGCVTDSDAERVAAFIRDIVNVCVAHGLSISHEDGHGAFEIEEFDDANIRWLSNARRQLRPR